MRWIAEESPPVSELSALASAFGLSETAASLLWGRGFTENTAADAFLDPRLARLDDPFVISHLREAVDRVRRALRLGEQIVVFGDYDVDGVTSTTLLVSFLRRYGCKPRYYVPRRLDEGYGLSHDALERVLEDGTPELFIAVDCGTSSREEVAWLRDKGIDVVIIDHHTAKEALPEDALLVNPHVHDTEDAPWSDLCTVGLVFKLIHGLLKALRAEDDPMAHEIDPREFLDLVALGTIADLVPLQGENRIFARAGLQRMKTPARVGLFALFEVAGLKPGQAVEPFDIAFRLAPRINASGRLDDASRPIEMLLGSDLAAAREIARELDSFNRERQEIEAAITAQAIEMAEANWGQSPGLILHSPEWHPGVVGIVASRISQHFHRPAIILGAEGEVAKGSGRSIAGIDLVEVLKPCADHLEKWGGHPMAVGVTATPGTLDALREAFETSIIEQCQGTLPDRELRIDAWVRPSIFTATFLDELERLSPFGQGNPEPVLGVRGGILRWVQCFGRGHVRFQLERAPGDTVSGIAWRMADNLPPEGTAIDLAVRFDWNLWNGRKEPRVTLVDWRCSTAASEQRS
jgi:single-stranded-DNA-specific exonuclease